MRRGLGLLSWAFAKPLRGTLVGGGLALAIIGVGVAITLVLSGEAQPAYVRQLAQAFAEFDKGNRARRGGRRHDC